MTVPNMTSMRKLALLVMILSMTQACSWTNAPLQDSGATQEPESAMGFTGVNVRLIGRFDLTQEGRARFTWPGSSLEFRFKGTAAAIGIAGSDRVRFLITVDGHEKTLWATQGERVYQLASGLKAGKHTVKITRLSESFSGVTAFTSDPVVQGKLLTPPDPPGRRLLVIGDSITAGYGVEGENEACGYSIETSDPLKAYAALAARALDADMHIIAWSGIGAWRSYGEQTPQNPTITARYPLALADDFDSRWNPADFVPDAILVTIGTNDYWDGESPGYRDGMDRLLSTLRGDYPETPVYLIVSPMLTGAVRERQKSVLNSFAGKSVTVLDLGGIETSDGYGCDYHPNTKTQSRMAGALVERLSVDLGWRHTKE